MLKNILLITICLLLSCSQNRINNINDNKSDIYVSKRNFGGIDTYILISTLDSLINALPYWRLDIYKTTDFVESIAVQILRDELRLKGLKTNEFIIYSIEKESDSIFVFHLDHIDSYVYMYNLDKTNCELSKNPLPEGMVQEIPPITGNLSGYEGWYRINLEKETLEITKAQ
ncbi:MAG TPA: hypothetical protein VLH61_04315 [Bacteroidales bacterium]|nr:hypothetical protein [Bacteroidales bacterium]